MIGNYATRIFKESDEKVLEILMQETFAFTEDFWKWKHRSYPNFTPQSIIVAEKDGKMIGATCWIPRDLKISNSLTVKAALMCDSAVDPQYRGQGIGSSMMKFLHERLKENGIVIAYGFARPIVAKKFYLPLDHFLVAHSTTAYTKFLNCDRWRKRISALIENNEVLIKKIAKVNLTIQFVLNGAPPFVIRVRNSKIDLEEVSETVSMDIRPDVKVRGDLRFLIPSLLKGKGILTLLKLSIQRKIRIKGSLRKPVALFRILRIIAPAFKQ